MLHAHIPCLVMLAALLLCGAATFAQQAAPEPKTLRQAAGDRILIGAAVMSNQLDDPKLAKLIAEQFNCLTPENEMKPSSLQPRKGEFAFENADKIVAFAQAHEMQVIGHNLCWH